MPRISKLKLRPDPLDRFNIELWSADKEGGRLLSRVDEGPRLRVGLEGFRVITANHFEPHATLDNFPSPRTGLGVLTGRL